MSAWFWFEKQERFISNFPFYNKNMPNLLYESPVQGVFPHLYPLNLGFFTQ